MQNILVEGHRGYAAAYPENTMISFAAAMELGVDAIEFDVWLTADKVPVLIHDGNCRRTCGVDVHVSDLTLAEVKALSAHYPDKFGDKFADMGVAIPTLEELLIYCREHHPNIRLGVEIKQYTEETVDLTVALLKQYGFFDGCWFYAFHAGIIRYLKEKYDGRTMGYPDFQMAEFAPDSYDFYEELGLNMRLVHSELLPFYMAKGLPVHMYCADTEEQVRFSIEHGASLITANDPVPLMRVLGRI
ncbi:MAG: glycerophosphodiester phosphodiesterase [Clostridia bacterium]|nr:glycerophosphodiester phosphodiesterase [Clostridia bacterium]